MDHVNENGDDNYFVTGRQVEADIGEMMEWKSAKIVIHNLKEAVPDWGYIGQFDLAGAIVANFWTDDFKQFMHLE